MGYRRSLKGAIEGASPDVTYLTWLGLVKGQMIAAKALWAHGLTDDAIGLSGHPEAEMMDEVRKTLSAHAAPDFSDALEVKPVAGDLTFTHPPRCPRHAGRAACRCRMRAKLDQVGWATQNPV